MTKISQREAHQLRRDKKNMQSRIEELEWQIRRWRTFNGTEGTIIARLDVTSSITKSSLNTAHTLKHAVLARMDGDIIEFRALPLSSENL